MKNEGQENINAQQLEAYVADLFRVCFAAALLLRATNPSLNETSFADDWQVRRRLNCREQNVGNTIHAENNTQLTLAPS